ncbi:hypothetical protein C802_00417 [Phocaeicola sartorii]|uniref:Uncharacterized protein n=1 Tax=Phocaeicola sartorii TaxID=671267 RepID=R9ICL0_9BACT|nr:hypothetical protein C802_00417 [Phocaeicola sartorii]
MLNNMNLYTVLPELTPFLIIYSIKIITKKLLPDSLQKYEEYTGVSVSSTLICTCISSRTYV